MRIVIAMDSFKGSMSSLEAGEAIKRSALRVYPDAHVSVVKIADGGEGTMDALCECYGAKSVYVDTLDPLGRPIRALCYATDKLFLMDVSSCIGLPLLAKEERSPMHTTTYGVGLIIKYAIERGYRSFIVGLGGSSTNDAGLGMVQALGFSCTDDKGNEVEHGAQGAGRVCKIDASGAMPALSECEFSVLCDVQNPLLGENGCTYIYSPQKGAGESELPIMDAYLASYAKAVKEFNSASDKDEAGSGAAGGLGFAFRSFMRASLVGGTQAVIKATSLDKMIDGADIVVSGEGRLDAQSLNGKAPMGVAKLASERGKRATIFCGIFGDGYEGCLACLHSAHQISNPALTSEENMRREVAIANLERASYDFFTSLDKKEI